jgi:hypothetical protein
MYACIKRGISIVHQISLCIHDFNNIRCPECLFSSLEYNVNTIKGTKNLYLLNCKRTVNVSISSIRSSRPQYHTSYCTAQAKVSMFCNPLYRSALNSTTNTHSTVHPSVRINRATTATAKYTTKTYFGYWSTTIADAYHFINLERVRQYLVYGKYNKVLFCFGAAIQIGPRLPRYGF